ncbi:ATP-dependent zinc protease [Sneathiella sp. HT1-7]|uniref:ATP-dependent zinc protease family protein n=1 Tax=Sneathiella sp. HT1-7 TaxID=2887192 RepID=UPI001D13A270|nr:RimK/LysX family protein [Sneathiella sp. HT1-7]MCC3305084.1 RimK/LysX family protein [Sneathiella sp. HT1-7]
MTSLKPHNDKMVIGWREWVTFPGLLEEAVKAKIDSGARTSAVHAVDIQTFTERGAPHVSFVLYPVQRRREPAVKCIAEVRDEREIMSSTGHRHPRYVIEIDVCLGGTTWPIEVTLADRALMGFRLLLGRQALKGGFWIDPSRSFIATRNSSGIAARYTNER